MKKFILIAVLGLFTFAASAQVSNMTSQYSQTTDTVTNAGTKYMYITSSNSQENISVQAVITKTSGTVAGTYFIQGSLDGTNYVSDIVASDSVTATNVTTNTKIWVLDSKAYKYYRVGYTGNGTMVATLKGYFFYNNPNK
jgi:hypothetical protein